MNSKIVGLSNKRSHSTIVGLIAAIAVLSGGLGLALTAADFDDQKLMTSNAATGFLMGHLEIEARNSDGEITAYRQTDNEVVDDGEQCILKFLFATTNAVARQNGATAGAGACTGAVTNAWNVIAIGDNNDSGAFAAGRTVAQQDVLVMLGNETSTVKGLERALATDVTWYNGTGSSATKIVLAKTFTSTSPVTHNIGESGLFNSTTIDAFGMLARQTFTDVSLTTGDSITVTWTFTVGN